MSKLVAMNSFEKVLNDLEALGVNGYTVNGLVARVDDMGYSVWQSSLVEAIIINGLVGVYYYADDKIYKFDGRAEGFVSSELWG
jgi:hypothetical protein